MSPEELMNSYRNPKPGWISVKDQLPSEDELVWLYSENEKSAFLGSMIVFIQTIIKLGI